MVIVANFDNLLRRLNLSFSPFGSTNIEIKIFDRITWELYWH